MIPQIAITLKAMWHQPQVHLWNEAAKEEADYTDEEADDDLDANTQSKSEFASLFKKKSA